MKRIIFIVAIIMGFFAQNAMAEEPAEGKQLFKIKCSACHKTDGSRLVGPGLEGITEKRTTEWLYGFIRDSKAMIDAGDEDAVAIFNEYNKVPMPAHPDLTDNQIEAIIEFLDTAGEPATGQVEDEEREEGVVTIPAKAMPSITPKSTMFQVVFWFSAGIIFFMALGGAYLISKYSK